MAIEAIIAILAMALATYGVRAAGLVLATRLPADGRGARFLRSLPPAVLVSIVAPAIATGGIAEGVAALATVVTAMLSRSLPAAMAVGVAIVWLLRHWPGG